MKSKDSKKRKSGFNPNCSNYLTADGKYYCYEYWDPKAKRVVTQKLEVGKDLSFELAILLDASDHDMDLIDRYENELRDPLFDAKSNTYKADPNDENALNPWDTLADKSGSPEYATFGEGDGALDVRIELDEARDLNIAIEERVREAKETAGHIAESIDRNGELACHAEEVIADCRRILGEIRSRGSEN